MTAKKTIEDAEVENGSMSWNAVADLVGNLSFRQRDNRGQLLKDIFISGGFADWVAERDAQEVAHSRGGNRGGKRRKLLHDGPGDFLRPETYLNRSSTN